MRLKELTEARKPSIEKLAKEHGITPAEAAEVIEDIEDEYEQVKSMLAGGKEQVNSWYMGFYDGYYNHKHKGDRNHWAADKPYYGGFEEGETVGAAHFGFGMGISKHSLKGVKPEDPWA